MNKNLKPTDAEDDASVFEVTQVELDTSQRIKIRRSPTSGNGQELNNEIKETKDAKTDKKKGKTDDDEKIDKKDGKNDTVGKENETEQLKVVKSASWYEKNFNEEKAKSRKDQEMQTETGDERYKTYYEYLQANSKGTQVEEDDKKTLSQMRFDLFKKNIHLKYHANVPLFEIRKEVSKIEEADNNRTFWEYLNYNNRSHVIQDRLNQRRNKKSNSTTNKSSWDNSDAITIEDVDEEEFYRRNRMKTSLIEDQNRFIWQIDEF